MRFKEAVVNRRINEKWFFQLKYRDLRGYKWIVEGEGFKDKEEATRKMEQKKQEIKHEYHVLEPDEPLSEYEQRRQKLIQGIMSYAGETYTEEELKERGDKSLQDLADSMTLNGG